MKNLIGIVIGLSLMSGVVSCGAKEEEKAVPAGVDQTSPEYKAYDLVQNLEVVKELQASAEAKGQSISLKLSKDLLNKGRGFYWFQVVQHVGNATIVKMNISVEETSYRIMIRDDQTEKNLTPEEYLKKYPIK